MANTLVLNNLNKKNMSGEFKYIVQGLQVLHALEVLEYHNKTLLYGSDATRSEYKQDEILCLISRVNALSVAISIEDSPCATPKIENKSCSQFDTTKSRQG